MCQGSNGGGSQAGYEKMWMACVAGVWQAGHSGSGCPQMRMAHSMQKRLWPHGTRAAITSLSKHTMHSREFLQAPSEPLDSVGEPEAPEMLLGKEDEEEYPVLLEKEDREPWQGAHGRVLTGSLWIRRANGCSSAALPSGRAGERRGVAVPLKLLCRR